MPGYRPLLAKSTPDQFKTWEHIYHSAPAAGTYPIFYCERDIIVDEVIIMTSVAGTSITFDIKKAATISASGAATILTGTISGSAQALSFGTIDTTANLVPGPTGTSLTNGNLLFLTIGGTVTSWIGSIQIRYRTRIG